MAKSRAVTIYHRRRANGGGGKIPLAILAGFIPGIVFASEPVRSGRTWEETWQRFIASFTGYDIGRRTWDSYYLTKGLAPVLGGMLAHSLAQHFGLNRIFSKFKLPVEI